MPLGRIACSHRGQTERRPKVRMEQEGEKEMKGKDKNNSDTSADFSRLPSLARDEAIGCSVEVLGRRAEGDAAIREAYQASQCFGRNRHNDNS